MAIRLMTKETLLLFPEKRAFVAGPRCANSWRTESNVGDSNAPCKTYVKLEYSSLHLVFKSHLQLVSFI